VVRRHLLAALSTGLQARDEDAARQALGEIDWVVRGFARRRLERVLIDATLATGAWATSGDPTATGHVLRLASLYVRGSRDVTPDDPVAVDRAFVALPPAPAPSRRPILTGIAVFVLAMIVVFSITRIVMGRPAPSRAFQRPLAPPSAGAFRTGGTPLADPALELLLRVQLTELVVATDHAVNYGDVSDPDRVTRHAALLGDTAMTHHGPGLAAAWLALLGALDHWAHLIPADRAWDPAVADLRAASRAVSDQLAALGLGYYLDGDVVLGGGRRHAILYAYRVEHVAFVTADTVRRRVLGLRRLDHLNFSRALLGMHSEELGDPLVLLDQIDEHVASHLLGLLGTYGSYPLGDPRWRGSRRGIEVGAAAGAAVRTELLAALGADAPIARAIGELAADRGELLDRWREYLELHHLTLRPVDTALLPEGYLPSLAAVLPADQRERMAALDAEMAQLGVPMIASRLHDLVAATVRRHEAQHAFDADRGAPLAQPVSLQMLVGPVLDADGVERPLARRAQGELSAYVSQIASDPVTPHLALWALARSAFDRTRWGRPESYVAAVVIDGLARELDVPSAGVVVHGGKIDRDRLGQLSVALAGVRGAELRAAAARLWAQLFAEGYVAITDVPAPDVAPAHAPPPR
jgi:hypothetical protein